MGSVELVKSGLGMPADWSMEYTTPAYASAIHNAVRAAKMANVRRWKNFVAPVIQGETEYNGVVAEIVSGDTLIVRVGSPDQIENSPWECDERRVSLSSIRAPRLGRKGEPDAPYA